MSINISLHIPIPSISFELVSDREEEEQIREPLRYNKDKEEACNKADTKDESCRTAGPGQSEEKSAERKTDSSAEDSAASSSAKEDPSKGRTQHG